MSVASHMPPSRAPAEAVRAQLAHILDGTKLQASPRLRRLLCYLVEETLAGRGEQLNQYRIAIDVFDRNESFDPATDASVRVEAGKLRRSLRLYYLTEGRDDDLQIELVKGSYAPVFTGRVGDEAGSADSSDARGRERDVRPPVLRVDSVRCPDDDPSLAQLAGSLNEELMVALARFSHIRVVREAPGRPDAPCASLIGTLRRCEGAVRFTVRIEEAGSSVQSWADAVDVPLESLDPKAMAERVVARVAEFDGALTRSLMSLATGSSGEDEFTATMLFNHYLRSFTKDAYWQARRALEAAVRSEQESAPLTAMLADVYRGGYVHGFDTDTRLLEQGAELARRSVALDGSCATARLSLAYTRLAEHRNDAAVRQAEFVLGLPSGTARGDAGLVLFLAGERERGLSEIRSSVESLDAFPGWFRHAFFLDRYLGGDFERALEEAEEIGMPQLLWDPLDRAAALGMLGEVDRAGAAIDELLALRPDFEARGHLYVSFFTPQQDVADALFSGLQKAGLAVTRRGVERVPERYPAKPVTRSRVQKRPTTPSA